MDPIDRSILQFVQESPDAVLIADREGIIRYWNGGAEQIFGYTAKEATGQSLDLFIPEKLRERHWVGYRRVMASGETKYKTGLLSSPGTRKDGTRVSLEFSIVLLRDNAGAVTGCASVMRDVTARWLEEKDLRARLADCEAKREKSA